MCLFIPFHLWSTWDCKLLNLFSEYLYMKVYMYYAYQLVKGGKVGTGAQAQYFEDSLARVLTCAA